jgi:hypothetical protein
MIKVNMRNSTTGTGTEPYRIKIESNMTGLGDCYAVRISSSAGEEFYLIEDKISYEEFYSNGYSKTPEVITEKQEKIIENAKRMAKLKIPHRKQRYKKQFYKQNHIIKPELKRRLNLCKSGWLCRVEYRKKRGMIPGNKKRPK